MGKRLNKGRTPPSVNVPAMVSKKVTKQSAEIAEEAVVTVMEQRFCVHSDKCVNLDKLLKKIKSCRQIKCGECKEGVHVKRRSEGKVNLGGKNGFSSSDPKSAKKAIWVCLECGHYVCGGVGLPTGAQSHVVRHIRLTRHRLVIQCENPQLRWCFPCQSLLPFEKEENGEKKDLLLEVVKSIKQRSSNTYSASIETEDSCSGSGSISGKIKLEGYVSRGLEEARDGYDVRGLVNLGNTCFFNSVLQNLLSLDQLREHFLKKDLSGGGPLVSSLKKLFAETKSEAGLLKSVLNPRAFFGSLCSKAPQFRGYQQHDSAKPETVPDKEAMQSNEDTAASAISAEIDEAQVCGSLDLGQSSSSANPWADEELPLMVADSQVLYLPCKDDKTIAKGKGVASSSCVSGHHELTIDYVDFSGFFDDPSVSCNDKKIRECEGEASSSLVSGDHEQNVDYVDFSSFFDEPEISEGPVFGPPSKAEGEAFSSFMSGIDYVDFSGFFDEPEICEGPSFWTAM